MEDNTEAQPQKFESSDIGSTHSRTDKITFHVAKKPVTELAIETPKIELMEYQKTRLKIAAVILIIVAALGIFYLTFQSRIASVLSEITESRSEIIAREEAQTAADIRSDILPILEQVGYHSAVRAYDDAIEAADTDSLKAQLYTQRAYDLYDYATEHDIDLESQVMYDLGAAEELAPSSRTAADLATYADYYSLDDVRDQYTKLARQRGYYEYIPPSQRHKEEDQ